MTEVLNGPTTARAPAAPPRWLDSGACAAPGVDPELFFPLDEDGPQSVPARRLCAGCPLSTGCLDYALVNNMAAGVWGGRSTSERNALVRARRRAAKTTGGAR